MAFDPLQSCRTEGTAKESFMDFLIKINKTMNRVLVAIGGTLLAAMIILTCANILIRQFYIPIRGTFELMGYTGAVVTAFALGFTQRTNGHIAVDVLVNVYPKKLKWVVQVINSVVCCVFFLLATWHIFQKAMVLKQTGEYSETLRIIYYPFTYAVALGCLVLSFAIFIEFLKGFLPHTKKESLS